MGARRFSRGRAVSWIRARLGLADSSSRQGPLAPDVQQDLVPAGLVDLVDAAAHHRPFGLPEDGGQAQCVHGHGSSLPFHHGFKECIEPVGLPRR